MEMIDSQGISWQGLIVNLINFSLLILLTIGPAIWIFFDTRKRGSKFSDTWLWMMLSILLPLAGLILYLLLGRGPKQIVSDEKQQPHQ